MRFLRFLFGCLMLAIPGAFAQEVAAPVTAPVAGDEVDAVNRYMNSIEVQNRKIQDSLRTFGVHPYDAVVGSPYAPALHERVGGKRVEGMGPLLVAEQLQRGWASQQPEFILRRPKVLVSE